MKAKGIWFLAAGFASLLSAAIVYAGGWVIVTVGTLPEYAVAGKPLRLTFMVRDGGLTPRHDWTPAIEANAGTEIVRTSAATTNKPGEYTATLVLPRPGNWTIRINAFGDEDSSRWTMREGPTLREFTVIASGSLTPPALSQDALGERLFIAKGCITCHAGKAEGMNLHGPDLSGRRFPEAYLKGFLADPQAIRGLDSEMPKLDLTTSEIGALTAFINSGRLR
jgi:hypothetical protein